MKKTDFVLSRITALLISVSVALPSPAFGLRPMGAEGLGAAELAQGLVAPGLEEEVMLNSGTPGQLQAWISAQAAAWREQGIRMVEVTYPNPILKEKKFWHGG